MAQLSDETIEWRDRLVEFLAKMREQSPRPRREDLSAREDEKRRVAGGALMQFLQFLQSEAAFEHFPVLEEMPIGERVFVFASDAPGVVAAEDIVDPESDRAVVATKHEWRAWLRAPDGDADADYAHHYEHWSVWHQNFEANWDLPDEPPGEFWVHEEGFALADRAGRGARHLWTWDGDELELFEQDVEQWTSSP